MDAAEYKHVVLGLIFLKYISDAFEEYYSYLVSVKNGTTPARDEDDAFADLEDMNEYTQKKISYVPPHARWHWLLDFREYAKRTSYAGDLLGDVRNFV